MSDAPPSVRAAWDALTAAWDQPARHDAFLAIVIDKDELAWAAKQYGDRKDDPIAADRLERLRKAAVARMFATATQKPEATKSSFRSIQWLLFVAVVMVIAGLLILRSLPQRSREKPPQPPVLPHQVR